MLVAGGLNQPARPAGPAVIDIAADEDKLYRLLSDGSIEFTRAKQGDPKSVRGYANWRVLPIDPDL